MRRIQRPLEVLASLALLGLSGPLGAQSDGERSPLDVPPATPSRATPDVPAASATITSPTPRAPTASYRITARLDETAHVVRGRAAITWTNRSSKPTSELWFHAYLNAFSPGSLFLTSKSGASRSGPKSGKSGALVVHSLEVPTLGAGDLWPNADPHSPDLPNDRTDLRVPLPRPVQPGERIEIAVEFSAELPEIVERTGYFGDYHLVAQWYPKLARLEPDGTWAHFPFHPFAEFYSDFGDYDVELDVPETHVVGASGAVERGALADGRAKYRATLRGAVDFAWTSFPGFSARTERVDGTLVRLLSTTDASRSPHLAAARVALRALSKSCAPYPYETLTIVEPPEGAERSGGMEYPSFITTSSAGILDRIGVGVAELTTVHEVGHQWFQGLLASDERRFPFLDEGLNSYFEARILDDIHGAGGIVDLPGFRVSRTLSGRLFAVSARGKRLALDRAAADYPTFGSLSVHIYARTALTLETLARVYGRERIDGALADYCALGAGFHPTPPDLYRALAKRIAAAAGGSTRALALIERLFEEPVRFDLSIRDVQTRQRGPRSFSSDVHIARGAIPLPFDVDLRFADGHHAKLPSSAIRSGVLHVEHESPLRRVIVDPDAKLLLDENLANNRRNVDTTSSRPYLTEAALAGLVQVLLRGLGS